MSLPETREAARLQPQRSVTIRQVENGYVMDMKSESSCYPYASIIFPTETAKVFTSLEDALKEVVKWMVPKSTGANIQIAV